MKELAKFVLAKILSVVIALPNELSNLLSYIILRHQITELLR
jgi:hypothetical protein